jgi:hypothetical protein
MTAATISVRFVYFIVIPKAFPVTVLFVQASATQVSDDNLKSVFREKSRWLQE